MSIIYINPYQFATPVGPTDPYFSNVSLLLHGDGTNGSTTIIDSSPTPKTVTAVGDAQISTAQSKFGGSSLAFDGNGDYLSLVDSTEFALDGDFTLELWLRPTQALANSGVISNGATLFGGNGFVITYNHTSFPNRVSLWNFASSSSAPLASTGSLLVGTWYHIAFCRQGSTLRAFMDGILQSSATTATTYFISANGLRIGKYWNGDLDGYIDDLRITKGVARYTSNFTPPTAPFPDI